MKAFLAGIGVLLTTSIFAQTDPPVKMSVSGICHQKGKSPYYAQTKKYTAYNTLDECLKAGGKMPKK
jgi:hypothetical protein